MRLRARVNALEQYQPQSRAVSVPTTKGNYQIGSTAAPGQTLATPAAPAGSDPASVFESSTATAASLDGSINFSAAGWVPDYFSEETPSLTGSRRQRRGRERAGAQ